jgi:heat shock protein HslJ
MEPGMKPLMIAALALWLGACVGAMEPAPASDGRVQLEETRWVLSRFGDSAIEPTEREPYLMFQHVTRRASGFTGCNMFTGSYELASEALMLGPVAMTRMACASGMNIESAFADVLRDSKGYKIEGRQLVLTDASGKTLASFTAK